MQTSWDPQWKEVLYEWNCIYSHSTRLLWVFFFSRKAERIICQEKKKFGKNTTYALAWSENIPVMCRVTSGHQCGQCF